MTLGSSKHKCVKPVTGNGFERDIKLIDLKELRSNELGMTSTIMHLSTFA